MALLRMMTTVNPLTGGSVIGGSGFFVYNTDNIVWGTLASKVGSNGGASSLFDYANENGTIGRPQVKASVTTILASAGALTIAGT
jgi:hypothetical protein